MNAARQDQQARGIVELVFQDGHAAEERHAAQHHVRHAADDALITEAHGRAVLGRVRAAGDPGHAALVPSLPGMTVGARAIVAAAGLVDVLQNL